MSVSTLHVPHGILLPSAAFVCQLNEGACNWNPEELIGMAAGHFDPLFTAVMSNMPEVTARSPQIKTILDATGLNGLDLSTGNTDVFFKKVQDLGTRVANVSAAHVRARITQGLLYWRNISARQGEVAEIDVRNVITWDGSAEPIVVAGSTALSGTSTAAEQFTLGPVKINSSFLPAVNEWTIDPGCQLAEELSDGDLYPTFAAILEHNPIILTVKSKDIPSWVTFGLGAGVELTGITWYLRRKTPDGATYANGASQHIKFDGADGIVLPSNVRAGGPNQPADHELRIALRAPDASTAPFTINTATTIT